MRRTVAELRASMSRAEFMRWWQFHRRNPIDPVSLYQKPAALVAYTVAAYGGGKNPPSLQQYLDSLVPPTAEDEAQSIFDSFLK